MQRPAVAEREHLASQSFTHFIQAGEPDCEEGCCAAAGPTMATPMAMRAANSFNIVLSPVAYVRRSALLIWARPPA
jgi:hypothetical protein